MFINTATPIVTSPTVPVPEVALAADVCERRRRALDEAIAEAISAQASDPDSWEWGSRCAATGRGCLALALAGTFDPAGIERVPALGRDLDRLAGIELRPR